MNLAGTTPGNSYTAVMTASEVNPSPGTVYRVEWGNGTGTTLWLGNGLVGIGSASGAQTQFSSEADSVRAVTIPNQAGRMVIAADLKVVLGSDFTHTTTSVVDVTGMLLTLPPGTWAVFFTGRLNSSNNDNGILLSTSGTATILGGTFTGDPTTAPATSVDFGLTAAVIASVASGTGTVQLRVANEASTRTAILRAGCIMFTVRIA